MMIPTVRVRRDGPRGWHIINADTFNPALHQLWSEDAPAAPVLPSREIIATMGKAEVREWLEAHGAEVPKGRTVAEMRADLLALMFLEA